MRAGRPGAEVHYVHVYAGSAACTQSTVHAHLHSLHTHVQRERCARREGLEVRIACCISSRPKLAHRQRAGCSRHAGYAQHTLLASIN
eukprot:3447802-Pleurochrysis_carterae.AAC.1